MATNDQVLSRLDELKEQLVRVENAWLNSDHHRFWQQAIRGFRSECTKEAGFVLKLREECLKRFWADRELPQQHRRIVETLAQHMDNEQNTFLEIPQRQLIKQSHISTDSAKKLLMYLEMRGYITKRTDGYRVFWKISP